MTSPDLKGPCSKATMTSPDLKRTMLLSYKEIVLKGPSFAAFTEAGTCCRTTVTWLQTVLWLTRTMLESCYFRCPFFCDKLNVLPDECLIHACAKPSNTRPYQTCTHSKLQKYNCTPNRSKETRKRKVYTMIKKLTESIIITITN